MFYEDWKDCVRYIHSEFGPQPIVMFADSDVRNYVNGLNDVRPQVVKRYDCDLHVRYRSMGSSRGLTIYKCRLSNVKFGALGLDGALDGFNISMAIFGQNSYYRFRRSLIKHISDSITIVEPVLEPDMLKQINFYAIDLFKCIRRLKDFSVRPTRGLLFYGPPGNGKSMCVQYIIDSLRKKNNMSINHITAPQLESAFANDTLEIMLNYEIVIFDDIDISYLCRGIGDDRKSCALLSALDGVRKRDEPSLRIFTSNENINGLDPAFMRPGRIDKAFELCLPTHKMRNKLIKRWNNLIRNALHATFIEETEGLSFAELDEIKNIMAFQYLDGHVFNSRNAINILRNTEKKDQKKIGFSE